jgi:hypothetical protein
MKNSEIGCMDIAKSIQALMTMANFMGHIEQEEGEAFRQYHISSLWGGQDNAFMLLDFAGQKFKLNICYKP